MANENLFLTKEYAPDLTEIIDDEPTLSKEQKALVLDAIRIGTFKYDGEIKKVIHFYFVDENNFEFYTAYERILVEENSLSNISLVKNATVEYQNKYVHLTSPNIEITFTSNNTGTASLTPQKLYEELSKANNVRLKYNNIDVPYLGVDYANGTLTIIYISVPNQIDTITLSANVNKSSSTERKYILVN